MKKLLFFIIYGIIISSLAVNCNVNLLAHTYMDIMTKDSIWHQFRFDEGNEISHSIINDTSYKVNFKDWIFGQKSVSVDAIAKMDLKNVEIPVVRISLDDYPEVNSLWEKDLYLDAKIIIEGNGYVEDSDTLQMQIKGRGNSTWRMPKKPMRLKFPKKVSIAGLNKAKSFVLLNNMIDPTMMRNSIAMWLAKNLEVPYANEMIPCHVFMNNHYIGVYTLTHKVGFSSGSIHDIKDESGILFEISTEMDEKYCFRSDISNLPVMIKDPDFDELYEDELKKDSTAMTPEMRVALWQEDFNNAESSAIRNKSPEAFDIESFINYILVFDISGNNELSNSKSIYMHKDNLEAGSKYKFGPVWDFDISFNSAFPISGGGYSTREPEYKFTLPRLFDTLRYLPKVDSLYRERYRYFENNLFYDLLDFIDEYASLIEMSAEIDGKIWTMNSGMGNWGYILCSSGHAKHVKNLKDWIELRIKYLHSLYLPGEPFPERTPVGEADDNPDDDEGDNSGNSATWLQ